MTLRQTFYQLVSRQVIDNTKSQYEAVMRLRVEMRKNGDISWKWIEERMRRPRLVSMWKTWRTLVRQIAKSIERMFGASKKGSWKSGLRRMHCPYFRVRAQLLRNNAERWPWI